MSTYDQAREETAVHESAHGWLAATYHFKVHMVSMRGQTRITFPLEPFPWALKRAFQRDPHALRETVTRICAVAMVGAMSTGESWANTSDAALVQEWCRVWTRTLAIQSRWTGSMISTLARKQARAWLETPCRQEALHGLAQVLLRERVISAPRWAELVQSYNYLLATLQRQTRHRAETAWLPSKPLGDWRTSGWYQGRVCVS
jgi:hypothetical protein